MKSKEEALKTLRAWTDKIEKVRGFLEQFTALVVELQPQVNEYLVELRKDIIATIAEADSSKDTITLDPLYKDPIKEQERKNLLSKVCTIYGYSMTSPQAGSLRTWVIEDLKDLLNIIDKKDDDGNAGSVPASV